MKYKYLLVFIALSFSLTFFAQEDTNLIKTKYTPTDVIQQQLDAYNLRDIDTFSVLFDDAVKGYKHPNELVFDNKEAMKKIYSKLFKETPNLHSELVNRMVNGNTVIDQERVTFGDKIVEVIAIYKIENNKIKEVYFIN